MEDPSLRCIYHKERLPDTTYPCRIGAAAKPSLLTAYEHYSGTHWDGCTNGGGVGTGHNSLNQWVAGLARTFGYTAVVHELRLGKDPKRPHDSRNKVQKADGQMRCWLRSPKAVAWDGTIVTAVPHRKGNVSLGMQAVGTRLATDAAEEEKRRAKEAPAEAANYLFMPWAVSSYSGMGAKAAEFFCTNFAEKLEQAGTDEEKWRVRYERKRCLWQLNAIVARRNWQVVKQNAWPRAGNQAPVAPRVEYE